MDHRTYSRMATMASKPHQFKVFIRLLDTGEKYTLKKISLDMTIKKLKEHIEFAAGIPTHLQRLTYLDEGELIDTTDIKSNDIVSGGTVCLRVWNAWAGLVEAVAGNDMEELVRLGVAPGSNYETPVVNYMTRRSKENLLKERAFVALFIAAHRGHKRMCEKLISSGANVNASTPLGRTALHVATAAGHGTIVDSLLDSGAAIDGEDSFGENALSISAKFSQKDCERHLFLWRWQQRADAVKCKPKLGERERFAHQYFDSAFPVWLDGDQAQLYLSNILPPGEFEGTGFSASKRKPLTKRFEEDEDEEEEEYEEVEEGEEEEVDSGKEDTGRSSKRGLRATVATLEPIEEMSIGSRSPTQSASPKKKVLKKKRKVTFLGFTDQEGKGGKGDKKVKSFDDWLLRKKAHEEVVRIQNKQKEEEEKWLSDRKKQESEVGTKSYDAWVREREREKRKERQKEGGISKLDTSQRVEKKQAQQKEPEEHQPDINELKEMFGTVLKRSASPAKLFVRREQTDIKESIKSVRQSLLPI